MKYSELEKIAERHRWTKIRNDDYWLVYTKDDNDIEIRKYRIATGISSWTSNSDGVINLNDGLDFINACIELGKTPPEDR